MLMETQALHIMIFAALGQQEEHGDQEREHLRHGDGPPDAVHTEENGQDQHRRGLEHQRPQEGDGGGDGTVVQGGEEAGGKDVEACQ